jgi:hypothetical protein
MTPSSRTCAGGSPNVFAGLVALRDRNAYRCSRQRIILPRPGGDSQGLSPDEVRDRLEIDPHLHGHAISERLRYIRSLHESEVKDHLAEPVTEVDDARLL